MYCLLHRVCVCRVGTDCVFQVAPLANSHHQPQRVSAAPNATESNARPEADHEPPAAVASMDSDVGSPTQRNDEVHDSELPYVPFLPDTQSPADGTSLDVDDTGAVHFLEANGFLQKKTQVTEEPSSVPDMVEVDFRKRGSWRDQTSQQASSHKMGVTPGRPPFAAPETPVMPRNPFANRPPPSVLAGSQLFAQTQVSSAIRRISPTSSRPSPNVQEPINGPNFFTSPLKGMVGTSSPMILPVSSPEPVAPSSVKQTPVVANHKSTEYVEDVNAISESPQPEPARSKIMGPMEEYEPMHKSQERKASGDRVGKKFDRDSSIDDSQTRRAVVAKRRREQAGKILEQEIIPGSKRRKRNKLSRTASEPAHTNVVRGGNSWEGHGRGLAGCKERSGPETFRESQISDRATSRRYQRCAGG